MTTPAESLLLYRLIATSLSGEDFPETITYGIRICQKNGSKIITKAAVEDIAPDRKAVSDLCRLMEEEQLDPVHLREVVEDFLS